VSLIGAARPERIRMVASPAHDDDCASRNPAQRRDTASQAAD